MATVRRLAGLMAVGCAAACWRRYAEAGVEGETTC